MAGKAVANAGNLPECRSDFVKNVDTYVSNKEFSLNFLILKFNFNLPTRSLNQESSLKHSIFKRRDF